MSFSTDFTQINGNPSRQWPMFSLNFDTNELVVYNINYRYQKGDPYFYRYYTHWGTEYLAILNRAIHAIDPTPKRNDVYSFTRGDIVQESEQGLADVVQDVLTNKKSILYRSDKVRSWDHKKLFAGSGVKPHQGNSNIGYTDSGILIKTTNYDFFDITYSPAKVKVILKNNTLYKKRDLEEVIGWYYRLISSMFKTPVPYTYGSTAKTLSEEVVKVIKYTLLLKRDLARSSGVFATFMDPSKISNAAEDLNDLYNRLVEFKSMNKGYLRGLTEPETELLERALSKC